MSMRQCVNVCVNVSMVFWQVSMQAKAAVAQAALMDAIKAKVCEIEKSDDKEMTNKLADFVALCAASTSLCGCM